MHVLVDGNNLLYAALEVDGYENLSRSGLCNVLARWSEQERVSLTIVFDGAGPPQGVAEQMRRTGVGVVFSGPQRSADEILVQEMHRSTAPRELVLVSSDRELRRAAKSRRAKGIDSLEFFVGVKRRLNRRPRGPSEPPEKLTGLTPEESASWLAEFGCDTPEP